MPRLTLKAARVNAGLTQKQAADKLKVSNKTISGWEKGKSAPSVRRANELCALYGVKYDDIFFLSNNPL